MGSTGDCFDNAMCESFFATLECELLAKHRFHSQAQAMPIDVSFVTLCTDSLAWTYMASSSDAIYSNVSVGQGQGIYRIDRATGVPTSLVNGAPGGAGGFGINYSMQVGQDGKLYETAYD